MTEGGWGGLHLSPTPPLSKNGTPPSLDAEGGASEARLSSFLPEPVAHPQQASPLNSCRLTNYLNTYRRWAASLLFWANPVKKLELQAFALLLLGASSFVCRSRGLAWGTKRYVASLEHESSDGASGREKRQGVFF